MPLCLDPKGLIRDREVRVGVECRAGLYSLSDIQLWFQEGMILHPATLGSEWDMAGDHVLTKSLFVSQTQVRMNSAVLPEL